MIDEWNNIKELIEGYYHNRYKMLGGERYQAFRWQHFFAPTLYGQRAYRRERLLLQHQIMHNGGQLTDLTFDDMVIKIQWCSIEIGKEKAKVTAQLYVEIKYKGIENRALEMTYHTIQLVKQIGSWYIESDLYTNEFDGIGIKEENRKKVEKKKNSRGWKNEKIREEATPKGIYRREKAVAYAKKYAVSPNVQQWKNYESLGGDCTNFVSQCLYAGEIPFDNVGKSILQKWYWYSDNYRTPSWTSADALKTYMLTNTGYGLVAKISDLAHMEIGDVVQLGTLEKTTHSMLVVDIVYDDKHEIIDLLVAQHSVNGGIFGDNVPLSSKPPERIYYKILGYNPQYT